VNATQVRYWGLAGFAVFKGLVRVQTLSQIKNEFGYLSVNAHGHAEKALLTEGAGEVQTDA
jgi:hypothetical protein